MSERSVTFYRWNDIPKEPLSDVLDRKLITADRMMLAHVYLKKGAIVPRHFTRTNNSLISSKAVSGSGSAKMSHR
jgi:hypothetical protein